MNRFDVDYIDEERGCVHIYHDDGDYVLAEDLAKVIKDLESRILAQNNQAWRYEDQIEALQAELYTVIYKHAEAEHTIIKLRAELGALKKRISNE